MTTKKCFSCGQEKSINDFYALSSMKDGHLNKCKECVKQSVNQRQKKLRKTDPAWVEKERIRSKEKYYRLNYRERQYDLNKKKGYKTAMYKNQHRKLDLEFNQNVHHWNYDVLEDYIILNKEDHRKIHRFIRLFDGEKVFRTKDGVLLDTKEKHIDFMNSILQDKEN